MKKVLVEQQKLAMFLSTKNPNTGVKNTRTDWLRKNEALRAEAEAANISNPNVNKSKPNKQQLDYYYNNPNNIPQEQLDNFFREKGWELPPPRGVI
jgi:hypothetical protein